MANTTISPNQKDLVLSTFVLGTVMVKTYIHPDADSSDGGWTTESGGTSLFSVIDEGAIDDNDYIKSSDHPNGDVCKIRLGDFTDPVGPPMNVSYRYKKLGTDGLSLTVRLLEGSTTIAEWVHDDVGTGFVTTTQTLTTPQFNSITDFTNLFLEFQADPGGSTAPSLSVEITFAGGTPVSGTLVYDMSLGTDIGDYVAPTAGFTQRCVRVRHASLPNFFVDFRPDISGGRIEVVFWNGECLGSVASGHKRDLTQYTAVVKNAGVVVADWQGDTSKVIAFHNWGNRWRFFTAWRSFTRTAAEVFSDNLMLPMSLSAARLSGYTGVIVPVMPAIPTNLNNSGTNGDGSAVTMGATPFVSNGCIYRFPMIKSGAGGLLSIDCFGDDGAHRAELGLTTEWQARWLLDGNADCLNVFMQQAEFASSQWNGFFIPDSTAGGPVNQKSSLTRYKCNMDYSGDYGNGFYRIERGDGQYASKGDEHSPQMWYIPWCLTEDPYYVEANQYHESYCTFSGTYQKQVGYGNITGDPTGGSGFNGAFTILSYPAISEERSTGWAVKNFASCWVMSPTSPPDWLLPKSYWAAASSDQSKIIDHYIAAHSTDPYYSVFHSFDGGPYGDTPQTFYKAYACYSMAFAVFVGLPTPTAAGQSAPSTWLAQLNWAFDWFRQTCDSTLSSGWNVQAPIVNDLGQPTFMTNIFGGPSGCTNGSAGVPPAGNGCASTYAQLWTMVQGYSTAGAPYPSDPSPGFRQGGGSNLSRAVAAAGAAKSAGATGAANVFTFLSDMIDYSYPKPLIDLHFNAQDGLSGT